MYQVWELPNTKITEGETRDGALHALDAECRRRHDQAVTDTAGPANDTFRFEIRNAEGRPLAWLTYSPDTSRPYETVILDDMLEGAQ